MKIAIDFDGTCVTHEYPNIGKDVGAVPVLKKLVTAGHLIILNTMRSGKELQDAIDWFNENDIPLYGVNEDPGQKEWTQSPKVFANLYIDDAALGCPLVTPIKGFLPGEDHVSGRPYVDWKAIDDWFGHTNLYFGNKPDPDELRKLGYTDKEIEGILEGWK
jgi:hypothetical protein